MKCTEWAALQCQKGKIWKVHSVYRRTVNIRVENRILAFHPETIGLTPLSLQIPLSEAAFEEFSQRAEKTGYVFWKEGCVSVGTRTWDTGELDTWNAKIPIQLKRKETGLLQEEIEQFLSFYGKQYGGMADSAVNTTFQPEDDLITRTLRELTKRILDHGLNDVEKMTEAAAEMIGLGVGLTPSGDDFLTGMMLAFHLISDGDLIGRSCFFQKIQPYFEKTNEISRQYLECAHMGEGSAVWQELFQSVNDRKKIKENLKCVQQIGHSSGMDTLNGVAVGLTLMKIG